MLIYEPQRVRVFRDQETAQGYAMVTSFSSGSDPFVTVALGASVVWDGCCWTIVNLGATQTTLLATDGTLINLPQTTFEDLIKTKRLTNSEETKIFGTPSAVHELLSTASPTDFEEANRRYSIIAPQLTGHWLDDKSIPARTSRRWIVRWKKAEARYGCDYVGLLPQYQERGNRQQKLPNHSLDLMKIFIANYY